MLLLKFLIFLAVAIKSATEESLEPTENMHSLNLYSILVGFKSFDQWLLNFMHSLDCDEMNIREQMNAWF